MQDVNGDGLPNDEWYELKGSEYGKPETIQDYAVTYFRPGPNMDTQWQDNKGNKGAIDRLGNYHPQEFYYPCGLKRIPIRIRHMPESTYRTKPVDRHVVQ